MRLALLIVIGVSACAGPSGRESTSADGGTARAARARAATHATPPPRRAPVAGEEIVVPAGVVRAGSKPGVEGREPVTEADLVPFELASYRIDRLPYPNDPAVPPQTGVTRAEAEAHCGALGKRLCHELEWERACEGDEEHVYPGGATLDLELCTLDPTAAACESPFGVLAMGTTAREWTVSPATLGLRDSLHTAIVRGGSVLAEGPQHRCAARQAAVPASGSDTLGFRCCRGAMPSIRYPIEHDRAMFREQEMSTAEVRRVLRAVPELDRFAPSFWAFDQDDVTRALARRRAGSMVGAIRWTFAARPLVWSPRFGEEAWIVAGTALGSAVIAVVYPMPDGTFVHGASLILENEPAPVLIAYSDASQRELLWSTCWGCGGEGGAITFRDDARIVIVQR